MEQIVLIIQVIAAVSVIVLVLIQQGKGAEVGASFGSGASQTIFGSQGSASFITRLTAIMAVIFFAATLGLGYLASHKLLPTDLDTLLESVNKQQSMDKEGDVPNVPSKP